MKNFLQAILFSLSLIFIASCSSDDPEPPHIVGDWEYEAINGVDFPPGYTYLEEIQYTITSYELLINNDGTFVERIGQSTGPSNVLAGMWTFEDDDLILNYDDESLDDQSYAITKNELDQLWYTIPYEGTFISESDWNTLAETHGSITAAEEYVNALDPDIPEELAELEALYLPAVQFKLRFSLTRK